MAEPDKDLPLVVAEILLELHGLNGRTSRVESVIDHMAQLLLLQQQETNKRFDLLMEADCANTTMLINAFREEATATRAQLGSIKNRLEHLENN